MKKSCKLLFVMSILSLLLSLIAALTFIDSSVRQSHLRSIEITNDNAVVLALSQGAVHASLLIEAAVFVAALILGISGLISSLKKGWLSILCIILDILPSAYILFGMLYWLKSRDYDWVMAYLTVFLFLAFYMAGAIKAFRGRKSNAETGNPALSE